MLRAWARSRCSYRLIHLRRCSSSSSSSTAQKSIEGSNNLQNSHLVSPPAPILHRPQRSLLPSASPTSFSRTSIVTVSAAVVSALVASIVFLTSDSWSDRSHESYNHLYDGIEGAAQRSTDSFKKIFHHIKQTGVAASVLWQSLRSVMSSANHEVRSGFELRVAALLADIAAANASRRAAIVGAGGGAVVDWLLESVAVPRDGGGSQAESARALAYLIADPDVSASVLGRPRAVPNLLRFIFSCQPRRTKQHPRRSSFDISDSLKGRSMLVAAIMDIVTSNCDRLENLAFEPSLPAHAETRDIAAAIQVIEEGGLEFDEPNGGDDEDGGRGIKGIGIKILGGTTILGLSRVTWALANWSMASELNRLHIHELDQDGHAVMTALMAPERSVKWHGSLVARLLLEDRNLPLNDSVSDWSSSLLSTVSHASKNDDIPLAQAALCAFLASVERFPEAQKKIMERGLHLMRDAAVRTQKHGEVQESLAKALELLSTGCMHLSAEESQRWSAILLQWVFGKISSESLRSSATKILSCILEDYGPSSIPISQGWLAILLTEILGSIKKPAANGATQLQNDKVKTKIEQSNIVFASQVASQLASAVVNLAVHQFGATTDSLDTSPLADLLSREPFVAPLKSIKKENSPKFDAADSAMATLKGIKALTEVCADDSSCQSRIADFGILFLLRRLLLCDDYEKLAAMEAYDASRVLEAQELVSNASGEPSLSEKKNDSSSVRVPPTAHIRRHAARLLTILSLLEKVQKEIFSDEEFCRWLEDCANGAIPGCHDAKLQSYARATLLNIFCINRRASENGSLSDSESAESTNRKKNCPRYDDMVFLINPELPHWKVHEEKEQDTVGKDESSLSQANFIDSDGAAVARHGNDNTSLSHVSQNDSRPDSPLVDVVFIHGLRGGPYKSWRISEDKSSTKSGLVEKIDQEAGKLGTFWPGEWLSSDFPRARMFTLKYKTNLTQWSGASLPLQEVSSMLLDKLVAAGIGDRPVVFVTHSMGGLVVKQMLYKAKTENIDNLVKNTVGVVFYSCPHFGSKLADMPWRMGLVFRPAPTIGELRSGSPRLVELNDFLRHLHKKGLLEVLSFCETKVTPIVEGYGGWAFRMEIVPIESAYPGFGELVVLESTDHINSCKPLSRTDPSYTETLEFLQKLKSRYG
uniref:GPI inositol-deacylase n=1 Tax=Cucumis sativus TaxID=3659 RepID=A0A0A0L2B0_CUCSA